MALARPLRLVGKPVTRVENMCATGSEALRAAVYAVACGAVTLPWPSVPKSSRTPATPA